MAKIVKVGAVDLRELLKRKDKEEKKEQEKVQEREEEPLQEEEALTEEDILDLAEIEEGKQEEIVLSEPLSEEEKDLYWIYPTAKALRDGYMFRGHEIGWLVSKMTGYSVNVCREIVFTALLILFSQLLWHKKVYIGGLCSIRFLGQINAPPRRSTATLYLKKTMAFYRFQREFWGENFQDFWSKKPNSIEDVKKILKLLGLKGEKSREKYCSVIDFKPLFEFLENKLRYPYVKTTLREKEEIMKDPVKRQKWFETKERLTKKWVERMIRARQKRKTSIGQNSNKGGQL